jgi:hypothetical protein
MKSYLPEGMGCSTNIGMGMIWVLVLVLVWVLGGMKIWKKKRLGWQWR